MEKDANVILVDSLVDTTKHVIKPNLSDLIDTDLNKKYKQTYEEPSSKFIGKSRNNFKKK